MGHQKPRAAGVSKCRICEQPGHFTKTCQKYGGQRFGSWTVVRGAACPQGRPMTTYALARCDCGVEKVVPIQHLKSGRSKSCGCSRTFMGAVQLPDMPDTVSVYGAHMSIGELATIAGRRPEYIWSRMSKRGMSAEEAAFGAGAKGAPGAINVCKEAAADRRARAELKDWMGRHGGLRSQPEWAAFFDTVLGICEARTTP